MKNLSIKSKTVLTSLIPLIVTALLLSSVYIWQRNEDINTAMIDSLHNTANFIATAGEFDVIAQNQRALQQLISAYTTQQNILSIQIIDRKGNLLAETSSNQNETGNSNKTIEQSSGLIIIRRPIKPLAVDISDYERTIPSSPAASAQPIGFVVITGTTQYAQQKKIFSLIQGVSITLIGIAIAMLIAFYLARTLSQPLANLAKGVARIARGDLGERLREDTGGEIGLLQKHINDMASALAVARDLERKQADHLLFIEKSKALTTLESLGEGVITTDASGVVTYLNPAATKLTSYTSAEAIGNHLHQIFRTVNANTRQPFDYPIQSCIEFGTLIRHDALLRLIRRDSDEIVIRDTATTIRDQHGNAIGAVLIFDDFTSLHAMAERLVYQATHDDLTGLYNRREFENQLEVSIKEVHSQGAVHVLCYIDLDQFKIVNDSCGHAAGDELLRQLGHLIKAKIRGHDILARLGGDEFGIIFKDCPADRAESVAQNILNALSGYIFTWGDRKLQVGASIGLVTLNKSQVSLTDVLIAADSACYIAKEQGRNRIHTYTPTDSELFKRRGEMQWFQRIKESLHHEQFELFAQRIVALQHNPGRTVHYEILLRLREGTDLFSPEVFLTTAERYNLMPQIDRWVIENTLAVLQKFSLRNQHTNPSPRFNINLSGQSLSLIEFHEFVREQLTRSGVSPTLITFEITETAAISNLSRAISFMNTFRELGCQFALDDFGSGLSSFGYLTTLPIDYIKIDGKLITELNNNPINQSIVEAINRIAHQMRLTTIAEYVQDKMLLERVRSLGIDYAQGFALAPLETIDAILSELR